MSNLNDQQFAKYTSIKNPDEYAPYDQRNIPVPASMERHAPGEYQPTLPGMEKMLPNEQTHTSVFFKHPNAIDHEEGDVPGSNWWHLSRNEYSRTYKAPVTSLHPTQDWMDENYLHDEPHKSTVQSQGLTPKVEKVRGKNVIHDGHHRAVREILAGKKRIDIERWG